MTQGSDTVLLWRHPEKGPDGNVTAAGLEALHDKLGNEWRGGGFNSLRLFVSDHKRGVQCIPTLQKFAEAIGVASPVTTSPLLLGLANQIDTAALDTFLTGALGEGYTEAAATSLLLTEYFDRPLPGATFTGREHATTIHEFMKGIARSKSPTNRRLTVAISHSGVIEYWLKRVYLENRSFVNDSRTVTVENTGGLVDFLQGPRVEIERDQTGDGVRVYGAKVFFKHPISWFSTTL